jgi:bacteriocin biosynthesis cyclodehydratase domain-containing protein
MRPVLRPGTHVLRRGPRLLQVGLDPSSAFLLTDSPAVRESLGLLATSAEAGAHPDPSTLDVLARHDALVDERDLRPSRADVPAGVPAGAAAGVPAGAAAAVVRDSGAGAAAALAARDGWRTQTRWFGHPAGSGLRDSFVDLAARAGLREAAPRRTTPPDCGVLVGVGEPDRDLLDGWTRSGTPYLLVRLTEGRAVVGPFVLPGTTACLRCVDAHHTDLDPAWPLLVRQYASAAAQDRADGAPEPVDPLLATLALAWAARDLASYVDGGRPSTWSSTLTLHPRLSRLETRAWLRHPACGCCWG